MESKKVLVMNLTPRWWMLHYSSQFCNELFLKENIELKVGIASYQDSILYNKNIEFIKIRTNPNAISFIIDTLNIFYHIYFLLNIIKFKPDIVHFLDNHPWYIAYSKIFKSLGYKIYVTQHDPILHSWENDNVLWKITSKVNEVLRDISDVFIVHWDVLKNQVLEKYKIKANKILSIKHWAYSFFNTWSQWLIVQKDTFLFFGRIVDYKWLDILLSSLEIVKNKFPDFRLIIAWPWDVSKYDLLLEKYKSNIEVYNNNIEPEEAYKNFEISEFVVLPYKEATWSGVIPVAYSFSKAVLVTNVWELSSVVIDWKTWYIVESNDSQVLWKKIVEMLSEKSNIKQMWKEWKVFSDKELSWKEIIDKIYDSCEKTKNLSQ